MSLPLRVERVGAAASLYAMASPIYWVRSGRQTQLKVGVNCLVVNIMALGEMTGAVDAVGFDEACSCDNWADLPFHDG